jgi:hypothetical protein
MPKRGLSRMEPLLSLHAIQLGSLCETSMANQTSGGPLKERVAVLFAMWSFRGLLAVVEDYWHRNINGREH